MALKLADKVTECLLKHPDQKLTAREIGAWILQTYPDECRAKQSRSTARVNILDSDRALISQLGAEIGTIRPRLQRRIPEIKNTEDRPRKYYYTQVSDADEVKLLEKSAAGQTSKSDRLSEQDLYSKLADFLWTELSIYSMRINEKHSKNSKGAKGNRWLYPDLVGLEDLNCDWTEEIKSCVQQYGDRKTKLWSFEVKLLVNRSNVREAYFQAISNSTWANFGYLVVAEISGSDNTKELQGV